MKKNILNKILKTLLIVLGVFSTTLLINVIVDLDVLPNKYFLILLMVLIVINFIAITTLLIKKIWTKVISGILYIFIFTISIVGVVYGNNTIQFFEEGFNQTLEEMTIYHVVTLKESKYSSLSELEGASMGYMKTNDMEIISFISNDSKSDLIEYTSAYLLYEDLTKNGLKSLIIEEVYLSILEEEYPDIYSKIKILATFEVESNDLKNDNPQVENKSYDESINIYITGSDSRSGKIVSKSRSDVNMIMTINPKTKTILLTSIPRDYYVQLHGTKGLKDKLTHSGVYGIEMSKNTIEDLLDIEIDYTIKVGFNSVIEVVDLVGGIDIYSEYTFTTYCRDGGAQRVNVKKGWNHFNGAQALSYARERFAYKTGDRQRIKNQQQVLEAIIKKASTDRSLLLKYNELLKSLKSLYRTDIPDSLIKEYIKHQLSDMSEWTIKNQSLNGTGAYKETYTMPGRKLYVMIPKESSVKSAKTNIDKVMK